MISLLSSLLGGLEAGLKLWNTKESRKYLDELISLKQDWVNEYNKDICDRSDAKLDAIEQRIMLISGAFSTSVGKPDSENMPKP